MDDLVQSGYLKQLPNDPMTGSHSTWTPDQEEAIMSLDQQDRHRRRPQRLHCASSDGSAYSTW